MANNNPGNPYAPKRQDLNRNQPNMPGNPHGYPPSQGQVSRYPNQPVQRYPQNSPFPYPPGDRNPEREVKGQPGEPAPGNKRPKGPKKDWGDLFGKVFTAMLSLFIVIYLGWLFAPRVRNAMTFWPTQTPSPVTPSPTAVFTPSITPLASNTPTMIPTETPGPLSAFWVADGAAVDPELAQAPDGLIILSADKNADVNPPLTDPVWTSSEKITSDLGKSLYTEKWFATYSSGWISWYMDQPLREGLYELFVMDTLYSSGGSLDFTVKLGEQLLTPLSGTSSVDFMTSQYEPVQSGDVWRSIGLYFVGPSTENLTVTSAWQDRDEYTIVAVDRLLIVPRRVSDLTILNRLTNHGTRYIFDDLEADIIGGDYIITQKSTNAWDDSYQLVTNPKIDVKITFPGTVPYPIGTYQLYAWMPASKGGITAGVQLYLDNKLLNAVSGEESASYTAPDATEGSWVEIGSWVTDRYYERPRKIRFTITIPSGSSGEFPIDSFALVHSAFEN